MTNNSIREATLIVRLSGKGLRAPAAARAVAALVDWSLTNDVEGAEHLTLGTVQTIDVKPAEGTP